MHEGSLLTNALYYLLAAVIAVPLFKRLGLGAILGYLCAGLVLGPHVLAVVQDPEEVLHFAEYGVILLLFVIGLELAPDKLWDMRGKIAIVGGSQLLVTAAVLTAMFSLAALPLGQAVVLGLTLALSSTAFAIQLMGEEHVLPTPLGRKGFAILLLQDLAVIPILLLAGALSQTASSHEAGMPWYVGLLATAALLVFGRFGLNQVLGLIASSNTREVMSAASLLIVIGVAVLMESVGLSMGLGAFLAGIMLANSDYRHQLESDIEPFKGILLGLFFIAVGMTLDLNLLLESPLLMIGGALLLVSIKTLVIVVILRRNHVPFKDGFRLGLMLCQGGEFAFVVLSQATQRGLFAPELADQFTLIVGLSMALTSPLVVLHRQLWHSRSESQPAQEAYWDTHEPEVIIAGFGRFGQIIGRTLSARHIPFTAMDKDSKHVEFVKRFGNRVFFGDLTRLDLLKAAGVRHAKVLVVAVDDADDALSMVDMAREQNPLIRIVARAMDRGHARDLHAQGVDVVVRETFASSLEAATSTLGILGFTEGQALEITDMFRKHDEALLRDSIETRDDPEALYAMAKRGREELEVLFDTDSKKPISQ